MLMAGAEDSLQEEGGRALHLSMIGNLNLLLIMALDSYFLSDEPDMAKNLWEWPASRPLSCGGCGNHCCT